MREKRKAEEDTEKITYTFTLEHTITFGRKKSYNNLRKRDANGAKNNSQQSNRTGSARRKWNRRKKTAGDIMRTSDTPSRGDKVIGKRMHAKRTA